MVNQQFNYTHTIKKGWPYLLIVILCFAGYFITKSFCEKKIIEKKIIYTSATGSEVYMVWGMMDKKLPPKDLWPIGSYLEDKMIWTKMYSINSRFTTTLNLPTGSNIYYWMVEKKDKAGKATDVWDSGGNDKLYFTKYVSYTGILRPGYFIFLAGFLPLMLLYFRKRGNKNDSRNNQLFKIKDYIPQFDSIRAIAVLLVLIHHWVPEKSILNFLSNGRLGVNIFFVLSGFLITGILLKAKRQLLEVQGLKRTRY